MQRSTFSTRSTRCAPTAAASPCRRALKCSIVRRDVRKQRCERCCAMLQDRDLAVTSRRDGRCGIACRGCRGSLWTDGNVLDVEHLNVAEASVVRPGGRVLDRLTCYGCNLRASIARLISSTEAVIRDTHVGPTYPRLLLGRMDSHGVPLPSNIDRLNSTAFVTTCSPMLVRIQSRWQRRTVQYKYNFI